MFMKEFYDADYIIRRISADEDTRIYNSPVERKLRQMIEENNKLLAIQNEKCRLQKQKLEEAKRRKLANANMSSSEEQAMGM